ncbi:hypothetical protein FIBSPDRAFT_867125 [Athelia psychrophila]|uniref:Uncharacterized protein n=1 Tax=Athelia psychrophila TaxID=1759441 RepID=A0A166EA21_9AGAM|nr:hypothetical protein FIBSPDRAFT_867125 [Fibularhizoctonia sp. CBS 109695]
MIMTLRVPLPCTLSLTCPSACDPRSALAFRLQPVLRAPPDRVSTIDKCNDRHASRWCREFETRGGHCTHPTSFSVWISSQTVNATTSGVEARRDQGERDEF